MWSKFFYSKNERNSSMKWKCCYNQLEVVDDWNKQLFCWFFATNGREITHTKLTFPIIAAQSCTICHTHTPCLLRSINSFYWSIDVIEVQRTFTLEKKIEIRIISCDAILAKWFISEPLNIKWFSAISKCDKTVANPKITHNASERRGEMWKNVITKHKTHSNW